MRIRKSEVEDSYDFEEAWLGEILVWPQAKAYRVAARWINLEPGSNLSQFPPPAPFKDGDLLLSFARLGARGEPRPTRIQEWVSKYGLLVRANERLPGDVILEDGRVNQKPMEVSEFTREVFRVRDLLNLYTQIRGKDYTAVRSRSIQPRSEVDRQFASRVLPLLSEDQPQARRMEVALRTLGSLMPFPLIALADQFLADELSRSLDRVRLRVIPGFQMPKGFKESDRRAVTIGAMTKYRLDRSWHCPDLLSAIYLQLYLLATKNAPMRRCENPACQTPFPAKPKHKRHCNASCRSNARHYR
ncbi:MAG: hypothetical protein ACRDTR_15980 [Rubrobacter sp.]